MTLAFKYSVTQKFSHHRRYHNDGGAFAMVNANVLREVGEVLESHGVTPRDGERLADAVSRVLGTSDSETQRWMEALSEGSTVEEANRRAGIASHKAPDDLLVAIARAIGNTLGKVVG